MAHQLLRRLLQGGAVAVAVAMPLSTPAMALGSDHSAPAPDQTPPVVTVDPIAHFTRWSQIRLDTADGDNYWDAAFFVKWKASDPSGICRQSITEQSYDTMGGELDPVLGSNTSTYELPVGARRYDFSSDLEDQQRITDRFVVRATDCAGNTATSGIAYANFFFVDDRDPKMTYTGQWRSSSFVGFAYGTSRWTTKAGDRVVIAAPPGAVGLVMESKNDRGAVDVYVDGAFRATVDTYSATTKHKTVVWEAFLQMGRNHTITVVNKGVPGRPRVDVDGLLTSHIPVIS